MKGSRLTLQVIRIAVAVTILTAIVLWMSGFFGEKIEPGTALVNARLAPPDAATVTLKETIVPLIEEAAGSIQAERKTVVSSRIMAVIREVRVSPGDSVESGEALIILDDRDLKSGFEEATRALQGAAAARQKALADYDRAKRLSTGGVISASELDEVSSAFKIADAEFERARQAVEAATIAVSYAEIKSPVSGRVVDRSADPGDTAVPGKPLLSLYDPRALRIEVPVRESLVGRLRVGDVMSVRVGREEGLLEGRVDEVVPQAEVGSRSFLVKIGLPRREGLYTGMFGRVLIPAGERRRLFVPAAAVEEVGQLRFAYVVDRERRVTRRLVTLGSATADGRVEVLSGLRAGETILARAAAASADPVGAKL